jgi:ABC-type sugar transport system ATPase subunit
MANQTEEKNHEIIVEMKNIDMRFQGVHALDDVSITLRRGEVHALMGENGAGDRVIIRPS